MENSETRKINKTLLLVLIIVASFAIRFLRLDAQSLWVDELLSIGVFTGPREVYFWKKLLHDVHGPLYPLIMYFWSKLGASDAWLRMPSAAFGVATVLLMYKWLARTMNQWAGILSALFLALNPFHLYYSQEVRFYSLLVLFSVGSLLCFGHFLRQPKTRIAVGLGIVMGLACLAHISALFLIISFFLYMLIARKIHGSYLRRGAIAAVIAILIASPLLYREVLHLRRINIVPITELPVEERLRGESTLNLWAYPYSIYAFSVGYSFGPSLRELHEVGSSLAILARHWLAFIFVLVAFVPVAIAGFFRSLREKQLWYLPISIAVTFLAVTVITLANVKVFNVRYLICVLPMYIAILVLGLPERRALRLASILAICTVSIISCTSYHFDPSYAREDVRGAARIIEREESPGDLIVTTTVTDVFRRYYHGPNTLKVIYPQDLKTEELNTRLRRYFEEHQRIWYVRSRHWDKDPGDLLVEFLSINGSLSDSWELPGVLVMLYER